MNWFGTMPAGTEGFEYHLVMLALSAVIVLDGGGALSLDRGITLRAQPPVAAPVQGARGHESARAA